MKISRGIAGCTSRGVVLLAAMLLSANLPGQITMGLGLTPSGRFQETKGLGVVFFSPADGWPWARLRVDDIRLEARKLGFFHVALLPALVLDGEHVELDLNRCPAAQAAARWQELEAALASNHAEVSRLELVLRQSGDAPWTCLADKATLGRNHDLVLQNVRITDGSGATWAAPSATMALAPAGGLLRVQLGGAPPARTTWYFPLAP